MTSPQKWGIALAAVAGVIVLGAAVAATFTSWHLDNSLTVAVIVAIVQVASALCFMQDTKQQVERERAEKPSDQLVESTTRRLSELVTKAVVASTTASMAREAPTLKLVEAKYALGVLSAALDGLASGIAHAQQDWKFHPAAVLDVVPRPGLNPSIPDDPTEQDGDEL